MSAYQLATLGVAAIVAITVIRRSLHGGDTYQDDHDRLLDYSAHRTHTRVRDPDLADYIASLNMPESGEISVEWREKDGDGIE